MNCLYPMGLLIKKGVRLSNTHLTTQHLVEGKLEFLAGLIELLPRHCSSATE